MNIQQVALEWPIVGVSHIAPLTGGINNHVWRIDAIDGHEYVLRIGSQKNHASHIRYESLILQILSQHALPFKTPIFLTKSPG